MLPAVAVSVAVPPARTFSIPALPGELLTNATEGFDELQMTDCRFFVLPSLNVPVAVNCCDCPGFSNRVAGVTAIETKFDGVKLVG